MNLIRFGGKITTYQLARSGSTFVSEVGLGAVSILITIMAGKGATLPAGDAGYLGLRILSAGAAWVPFIPAT